MFDTFSPDAQSAIVQAQELAREHGYSLIGLQHLRAAVTPQREAHRLSEHEVLERIGLHATDAALVEQPPPIPFDDDVKACLIRVVTLAEGEVVTTEHLERALSERD